MSFIIFGGTMENRLKNDISIIGVPLDMGASQLGTRLGPEAIRIAGLIDRLEAMNYSVEDLGNMVVRGEYNLQRSPENLNHIKIVKDANENLSNIVDRIIKKDRLPLVLGGDHSSVLGTVKGVLNNYENPGIIYFDAHADINTAETSPTGNIHGMPIAALMGMGDKRLTKLGEARGVLKPENIVYIGLRDLDPGEREIIRKLNIKAYSVQEIDRTGIEEVMKEAIEYITSNADAIHISFDVDCLDPKVAPGTGVKVLGGLNFREAKIALELTSQIDNICSVEFVEVNPLLDEMNETAEVATALIGALFGESQL